MLRKIKNARFNARHQRFAIVASQYNGEYVEAMLAAALRVLKCAKAKDVQVVRVPGAYEIPVVARHFACSSGGRMSAVICLGVILRGETTHAKFIGEGVSRALMNLQLEHGVPIIHEVLLLESHDQARARCLDPKRNRGTEAAQTALAMAKVMEELDPPCPF